MRRRLTCPQAIYHLRACPIHRPHTQQHTQISSSRCEASRVCGVVVGCVLVAHTVEIGMQDWVSALRT